MTRSGLGCSMLAVALALLPGCGGGGNNVKVSGKLLKSGSKYSPPEGQRVSMTFYAIEAKDEAGKSIKNEPFQATIDRNDGSFEVPGSEGYGIPPGSYRIAVTQKMDREAFERTKPKAAPGKPKPDREADLLEGRFSPESSPIVREIGGRTDLVIDLDKPTEGGPAGG